MVKYSELPRHPRRPAPLGMVGLLSLAAALLLACQLTHMLPPVLKHAPASALTLNIHFEDSPFDGSHFANTQVGVTVFVSSGGHAIGLSSKQKLMCNGVQLYNPETGQLFAWIDRQPAGGSYAFTYTDEQGRTTAFRLPAIAPLTFLSPAPGATIAIPRALAVASTPGPYAPPTGTRTPDLAHAPLTVRYTVPRLPPGAQSSVGISVGCGPLVLGPPTFVPSGEDTNCGSVAGPDSEPATGTYVLSDATTPYGLGFETFVPGPGSIGALLQVTWAPVTAFKAVGVIYFGSTIAAITWTAP